MSKQKWATRSMLAVCLLLVGSPNSSFGQIARMDLSQGKCVYGVGGAPNGFTANQISINFDGQLQGQQIQINLSSGSIYTNPFASPFLIGSPALVAVLPDLACTSFVSAGDLRSETLIVSPSPSWSDLHWAPGSGVDTRDRIGFLAAQITLSSDAEGTWSYLGLVDNHEYRVEAGFISGGVMAVPEASTMALFAAGLVASVLRRSVLLANVQ